MLGRYGLMVYRAIGQEPDEGDLETGRRTCRECCERKAMAEYHWTADRRYRRRICSSCVTGQAADRRADRDPAERRRAAWVRHLRLTYGLTVDAYDLLLASQGGACAICRTVFSAATSETAHVDHDHASGAVRGILCFRCNTAIGKLRDDPALLAAAISYLTASPPDIALIPRYLTAEERSKIARERRAKGATPERTVRHSATATRFGVRKISSEQAAEIRGRYAAGGISQQALAGQYGVSQTCISKIVKTERIAA